MNNSYVDACSSDICLNPLVEVAPSPSLPLAKGQISPLENHLVVVDPLVENVDLLIEQISAQVVVLDGGANGIDQLTQLLSDYEASALDGLHIISHGRAGALQLGDAWLGAGNVEQYADELTGWGEAIAPEGDILLYGCDTGAGLSGQQLVDRMSQLTDADIAASDDLTGDGGDWDLEVVAGSIEAQVILDTLAQSNYRGTLASYNGKEYRLTAVKTWEEAQAEARSLGGNLVTINDAAEEAWLKQTFGSESLWMGMTDRDQEGSFRWVSGEAVTYRNWAPGEPNDWEGTQDYGTINFGTNRQWDDDHFYSRYRGIVEIDANDDEVKTYSGSDYRLTNQATWEDAQAEARSLGGNLVTINDAAEEAWLKQTFGSESLWMGMTDRDQEGSFKWASGETVTYRNWAPGEPNDWEGTQDYGTINFGENRQWDDDHFYSRYRGIVEIKRDVPPNPGVPQVPSNSGTVKTYNGSQYRITGAKTWEEAQAEAKSLGGNLVTINTAAEDAWLKDNFGTEQSYWMGLSDRDQEGSFAWASGEAVTYTNWAAGEPNDYNGGQDYGRINFGGSKQWDDEFAYTVLPGIVEIGSNAPLPVVTPPVTPPNPGVFSRVVPVAYSGYNADLVEVADWSDISTVSALASAATEVGAQTLRLPGGDAANYWDWDLGGVIEERNPFNEPHELVQPLPLALQYKYGTNATLGNVKPLITGTGAEPIWVVNMLTSDLNTEIRHLVEAKNLGLPVNRIELGNELEIALPNYTRRAGGMETAAGYAAKAKEWALAIKANPLLSGSTIAITGVAPEANSSQRVKDWWPALTAKTGTDNRSALDVVDAFTLHPYYAASDLNVRRSDVGIASRAGQIARDGIAKLRNILDNSALDNPELQSKQLWITEHNVLEDSVIVLGNSWFHALMMDLQTQEFLKDERTTISIAHVLTGNAQWQALTTQEGTQLDGTQRGRTNRPITTRPGEAFQPTALGFVLGETADVFDAGNATLLGSGNAYIAWRVQNSADDISAVNADDQAEQLVLPAGRTWRVRSYSADPWKTVRGEGDLNVNEQILTGGSTLTISGFTKVVATAV